MKEGPLCRTFIFEKSSFKYRLKFRFAKWLIFLRSDPPVTPRKSSRGRKIHKKAPVTESLLS